MKIKWKSIVGCLLLLSLVACGSNSINDDGKAPDGNDVPPQQSEGLSISVSTYVNKQPQNVPWLAYQDGAEGEWKTLSGNQGIYQFKSRNKDQKYGIVAVCPPGSQERIRFFYATTQELPSLKIGCEILDPLPTSDLYLLQGKITGLSDPQEGVGISLGREYWKLTDGFNDYEISLPAESYDLLAAHYQPKPNGGIALSSMILQHDILLENDLTLDLDFSSLDDPQGAFALEALTIQLIGVGNDAINAGVQFQTGLGSSVRLGSRYGSGSPTLPFMSVPLNRQGADDLHFVYAEAYPPGAGTDRIAMRFFKDAEAASNLSLTIPTPAFSSAQVKVTRLSPTVGFQADWTAYAGPLSFYRIGFANLSVILTPGWLGSKANYTYELPDLSGIDGCPAGSCPKDWFRLQSGGQVLCIVDAYSGNRSLADQLQVQVTHEASGEVLDGFEASLAGRASWVSVP